MEYCINRLCCGYGDDGRENYASWTNNFIYQNTNDNYKNWLWWFKSGEILLLSYNNDLNQSSIETKMTFGWFVTRVDDKYDCVYNGVINWQSLESFR